MNQHYNQNYTWEQINEILAMIHDCIREGRFIISKNENRQENIKRRYEKWRFPLTPR